MKCIDPCQRRGLAPRSIIISSAVIVSIIALAALAYWFFLLRGPLAGETHHDFGSISVPWGGTVELVHTFHLSNRTSHPISVRSIHPECGCITVHAQPKTIQPGESFDVPITFALKGVTKSVLIEMDLGEAGFEPLVVKAAGHYLPRPGANTGRDATTEPATTAPAGN